MFKQLSKIIADSLVLLPLSRKTGTIKRTETRKTVGYIFRFSVIRILAETFLIRAETHHDHYNSHCPKMGQWETPSQAALAASDSKRWTVCFFISVALQA